MLIAPAVPKILARDVIISAQPSDLAALVRAHAWVADGESGQHSRVYRKEIGDNVFAIDVPTDRSSREYPLLVDEVVRCLAVAENASRTEILSGLLGAIRQREAAR